MASSQTAGSMRSGVGAAVEGLAGDPYLVADVGGAATPDAPMGLIGPGTGLGVSGLVRLGGRWEPLAGEGGHASLAPEDEQEATVLGLLRRRFGHVSAERVLSGPGLVNLHAAL